MKKQSLHPKVGIIIQARMGSERLPGKILKPLGRTQPILAWVVERCRLVKNADLVIVATTENPKDNEIAVFCEKNAYAFFRGSENDVLNRYLECAKAFGIETVVRITSDCPFIAPKIIEKCIARFHETGSDYLNNSRLAKTFPRGLDVEVVSREVLEKVALSQPNSYEREHVTLYIYQHPDKFRIETVQADPAYQAPDFRLTVDTAEDFEMISEVAKHFQNEGTAVDTQEIIAFLRKHPEILSINKEIKQKPINGVTV